MTTDADRALWITLPGAGRGASCGWLAWAAAVTVLAPVGGAWLGTAGTVLVVLGIGWLLARYVPTPIERLRGYHLDDHEVTTMGPLGRVRRMAWSTVDTITQGPQALRLDGGGTTVRLPLGRLVAEGAWGAVLARVVPALADEMWALMEEGEDVRLQPPLEPRTASLAWWSWAPALLACAVAGAGWIGAAAVAGLAASERLVTLGWSRLRTVTFHREGAVLRSGLRSLFVAWPIAEAARADDGLLLGQADGPCGRITTGLPNFWAAAPVIELKTQVAPQPGAHVSFRVRVAEGRLAVIGEVEPSA